MGKKGSPKLRSVHGWQLVAEMCTWIRLRRYIAEIEILTRIIRQVNGISSPLKHLKYANLSKNSWIVQTAKNVWTRKLKLSEVMEIMDGNQRTHCFKLIELHMSISNVPLGVGVRFNVLVYWFSWVSWLLNTAINEVALSVGVGCVF